MPPAGLKPQRPSVGVTKSDWSERPCLNEKTKLFQQVYFNTLPINSLHSGFRTFTNKVPKFTTVVTTQLRFRKTRRTGMRQRRRRRHSQTLSPVIVVRTPMKTANGLLRLAVCFLLCSLLLFLKLLCDFLKVLVGIVAYKQPQVVLSYAPNKAKK